MSARICAIHGIFVALAAVATCGWLAADAPVFGQQPYRPAAWTRFEEPAPIYETNPLASEPSYQPPWQFVPPGSGGAGYLRTNTGQMFRIVPFGSDFQPANDGSATETEMPPIAAAMEEHAAAATVASGTAGGESGAAEQDNGTNPATNARTVIFDNMFYALDGDNAINTMYLRLKYPTFGGKGSFMAEIPFNF